MKRLIRYISFLAYFFACMGCDKEIFIVDVNVSNTQTYVRDLQICGDEEGALIFTQAQHFEISEIRRDSTTDFCVVYFYRPEAGYTGEDFVSIRTNTGSNGASKGQTKYVEINFTVTN